MAHAVSATSPIKRFNVVITGSIRTGFDPEQVKTALARLAKIDPKQAAALLGGGPRVVKSNVDQGTATQFQARFEAIGVQCAVRPATPETDPAQSQRIDSAGSPGPLTAQTLKSSFSGEVPGIELTRNDLLLRRVIAGLTLLVPVGYIVLILALGYFTLSHLLVNWSWIVEGPMITMLIAYVLVGAAGVVAVPLLLKPLIAPAAQAGWPVKLNRQEDALFFAFVEQIAQRVGAPMPIEIHIDCRSVCTVTPRNGLSGLLAGEWVLRVGLPLIGGLKVRQLAAVIAHALGRRAPSGAEFAEAIIALVLEGLQRRATQPDLWDERLSAIIAQHDDPRRQAAMLGRAVAWLGKQALRAPLLLAALLGRGILHRLVFEADHRQIHLSGAAEFEGTLRRIRELAAAEDRAQKRGLQARAGVRLSDNLPASIIDESRRLPERTRDEIDAAMQNPKASLTATAPTDRQRIERAAAQDTAGIFTVDAPGEAALPRYERLCKQATLIHYRNVLKLNVSAEDLASTPARGTTGTAATAIAEGSIESLKNYTGGAYSPLRMLKLRRQAAYAAPDLKETRNRIDDLVQQLRTQLPDYLTALREYSDAHARMRAARTAQRLLDAGIAFEAGEFGLPDASPAAAAQAHTDAGAALGALEPRLTRFESLLAQRLEAALATRVRSEDQNVISPLTRALGALFDISETVTQLRVDFAVCNQAIRVKQADWTAQAASAKKSCEMLVAKLNVVPDPFAPAGATRTLAAALQQRCGKPEQWADDVAQFAAHAAAVEKYIEQLYLGALARLAELALVAEEEMGVAGIQQARAGAPRETIPSDQPDDKLPF